MKKLITFAFVVVFAVFANASELWWTIDTIPSGDTYKEVTKVTLYATSTWNYGTNIKDSWANALGTYSTELFSDVGYVATDLGNYADSKYSFFIELQKADGTRIAASSVSTSLGSDGYSSANIQKALYAEGMSTYEPTVYTFGSYSTTEVVPEPTSGLLLLIGFAGLALRRKRV